MKDAQIVIIPNSLKDFFIWPPRCGHFLLASCVDLKILFKAFALILLHSLLLLN